jgi:predicted RNase H-like HicB family nuclease
MRTRAQLTVQVRRVGSWWAATVKELPEVHTQGRTLGEVLENVGDACEQICEAKRALAARRKVPA